MLMSPTNTRSGSIWVTDPRDKTCSTLCSGGEDVHTRPAAADTAPAPLHIFTRPGGFVCTTRNANNATPVTVNIHLGTIMYLSRRRG